MSTHSRPARTAIRSSGLLARRMSCRLPCRVRSPMYRAELSSGIERTPTTRRAVCTCALSGTRITIRLTHRHWRSGIPRRRGQRGASVMRASTFPLCRLIPIRRRDPASCISQRTDCPRRRRSLSSRRPGRQSFTFPSRIATSVLIIRSLRTALRSTLPRTASALFPGLYLSPAPIRRRLGIIASR